MDEWTAAELEAFGFDGDAQVASVSSGPADVGLSKLLGLDPDDVQVIDPDADYSDALRRTGVSLDELYAS